MKKFFPLFVFMFLVISLFQSPAVVKAQDCAYADIIDLTGTLNREKICQASRKLAKSGYSVFIYFTREAFPYNVAVDPLTLGQVIESKEWDKRLDQAEKDSGVRNDSGPVDSIFALEVAERPLVRILIGNKDLQVAGFTQIRDSLESQLDVDATTAFVSALETATQINDQMGFFVKRTQPIKTPKPATTPKPPFLTTQAGKTFVNTLKFIVVSLFWIFVALVLFYKIIKPWQKHRKWIRQLTKQSVTLKQILSDLDDRYEKLFHGNSVEETSIYQYWLIQNGSADKSDGKVQKAISRSRQAHEIIVKNNYLNDQLLAEPQNEEDLINLVKNLEELYLLFVGTTEQVLGMTSSELENEFNPLLVSDTQVLDDALVKQAQELSREWSESALKVSLMFADPRDVNEMGILGNIVEVKEALENLIRANREKPED